MTEAEWLTCTDPRKLNVVKRSVRFLRDIFGNPFGPVPIDPTWRTRRDGTIPKLAQAICGCWVVDLLLGKE